MRKGMLNVVFIAVLALVLAGAETARAVDAPKWVAALYVQAQNAVGMRWGPVPGATGYKVLRSTTKGADYKEIATATSPQAFDPAIEAGTTYYYVLQAVAGAEVSANSDERSVNIPGTKRVALTAPEIDTPIVQSTVEFGKTSFRVGITWKPVAQAVAYNLYRSTEAGKNYELLVSGADTRTVDARVEEGKTYYYVVTALDEQFQETPYSKEVTAAPKAEERKEKKPVKVEAELKVQAVKIVRRLGTNDPGLEKLNNPASVAVTPDGKVFVTDTVQSKVRAYDDKGNFLKVFGQPGDGTNPGDLQIPTSITWSDGLLYVVSPTIGMVQVFSEDGTPRQAIVVKDPLVDARLYVTAFGVRDDGTFFASSGGKNMQLMELNDKGVVQTRYTEAKLADGDKVSFGGSGSIAFDSQGTLYAASTINFSVHAYNKKGENSLNFGQAGDVAGKFLRPVGLAVDKKDRIWVTDIATSNIQVFDNKTGDFLYALGAEKEGESLGLTTPMGIAVADDGKIYIAEGLKGQVTVLEPVGEPYKIDLKKVKH